jgi:hypothetical protein
MSPFYVGKGTGNRVLQHWANAASDKPKRTLKRQEQKIREILSAGHLPTVKLLAYNLECTKSENSYSLVERVIQDAFGIQHVWEKRPGASDRLKDVQVSSLVQIREDGRNTPVQSLDSLIGLMAARKHGRNAFVSKNQLADMAKTPVLLVGLSKTYHATYSANQLAEMARMYWVLRKRFANTTYPALEDHPCPILLAWYSLNKTPTIVGAWRIKSRSFEPVPGGEREKCEVEGPDLALRRDFLGLRLEGTGRSYYGPQIILPSE